jgi:hypothetical protein
VNEYSEVYSNGTGSLWFANLRYEGYAALDQAGYGYTALTGSPVATTYDIKYLHPLSLCAGTTYHVSSWVRNNRRGSAWTEGCRVTAFLDGQSIWSDRIGSYDWYYRYLDGTFTPSADTTTAEFFLRIECRDPQGSQYQRPRGVKLDNITVLAESQYTAPADIVLSRNRPGCLMFGEQFSDAGFEAGADTPWTVPSSENANTSLSGPVTDDSHTGTASYRFVFGSGGGSMAIAADKYQTGCVERTYSTSFWTKQASNNACTVSLWWGSEYNNVTIGPITPSTEWAKTEQTFEIVPQANGVYGIPQFRVKCAEGGIENAVWIDDVSFGQPKYFNA